MTTEKQPAEATPRPWIVQRYDDDSPIYIDTHAYPDGPEPVWAASYPVSLADAALIVAAVNDYDRLLRVAAAAREWRTARDKWKTEINERSRQALIRAGDRLAAALDHPAGEGR